MSDKTVMNRINELIDEERELRRRVQAGEISSEEEHARLRSVQASLDQCWDLLRRRRAAREQGEEPDQVRARAISEVEGYLQ